MKAGVEITVENTVQINPGSFFSIGLTSNHQMLPEFSGLDRYAFPGLALRGKRIAASGRIKEYGFSGEIIGLGSWEAAEVKTVEIPELLSARIRLVLNTNVLIDKGLITSALGLRFIADQRITVFDLPLACPLFEVIELGEGKYSVELTELIRERAEKLKSSKEKSMAP